MRYEGWHRALDVQMDTHKHAISAEGLTLNSYIMESLITGDPTARNTDPQVKQDSEIMARNYAETLWRGDTIFITREMMSLIMQAAEDLPDEAAVLDSRILMSDYGFVMFEEPLVGTDRNDRTMLIHSVAWQTATPKPPSEIDDKPERMTVVYYHVDPFDKADYYNRELTDDFVSMGHTMPAMALQHFYPWIEGKTPPFERRGEPGVEMIVDSLKIFLAMHMLSHQSIGTPIRQRPDRASRKRYAREYPGLPERMITLITLRRKSAPSDKPTGSIEWQRRWVVRGHWRRQYYPKTKTHGWKYIYEHVKGPEDKPLITGRRIFNFRR